MERCETVQNEIQEIVEVIRSYKSEMRWLEAYIDELKGKLQELLEAHGNNWNDDRGYARIIAVEEHSMLDADALNRLIIEDPIEYGWLKGYYRDSAITHCVQVK